MRPGATPASYNGMATQGRSIKQPATQSIRASYQAESMYMYVYDQSSSQPLSQRGSRTWPKAFQMDAQYVGCPVEGELLRRTNLLVAATALELVVLIESAVMHTCMTCHVIYHLLLHQRSEMRYDLNV